MKSTIRTAALLAGTALATTAMQASAQGLDIYGYVKFDAMYDMDYAQGPTQAPWTNSLANATNGSFDTNIRQSRLGFKATEGEVKGQLEFDLFGSNATGSTYDLRVRHANITYQNWLFGQTWSNFTPIALFPRTVDFAAPVGSTVNRAPQVRYTHKAGGGLTLSGSVEENVNTSESPLVTAAVQYSSPKLTLRGVVLAGEAVGTDGEDYDQSGFNLAALAKPWEGGRIAAHYTAGTGLGRYLNGGFFTDSIGDAGSANDSEGIVVELRQDVNDQFSLGAVYGVANWDNAVSGVEEFDEMSSFSVNAYYKVTPALTLMAEFTQSTRTNMAGDDTTADRVQAAVQFNF